MSYCIYLRKSRADAEAEARGEGETLARHEKALVEIAHRQNLHITQVYREVVSGDTIAARPVMQQLLADVDAGRWAGVLVMEIERLARGDTIDQGIVAQAFKYSNTKIITPIKTFDPANEFDEEYFEFNLYMSRREYKTINRRQQRGRLASAKEGKFVGHVPAYGYLRQKIERSKGWKLVPDPERAPVVRQVFEWYTTGALLADGTRQRLGVGMIVNRLTEIGVTPAKGGVWSRESIREMLINPVYTGKIRYGFKRVIKKSTGGKLVKTRHRSEANECELYDGLHDALVSQETFDLAQEYMCRNPKRPAQSTRGEVRGPLVGLVVCGVCGRRMTRRINRQNNNGEVLMCPNRNCSNVSSYARLVEDRLLSMLAAWIAEYRVKLTAEATPKVTSSDRLIKRTQRDLDEAETQKSKLFDLLERGVYSIDVFAERSAVLDARIASAKAIISQLQADAARESMNEEALRTIVPRVERLLTVYVELDSLVAKNELLKSVLDKVVYVKDEHDYRSPTPDSFQLTLYPLLPNHMP